MFPMIEIEMPPTDYAIKVRPWFVTTLVFLMAVVVGKFVISDYWGAVSLIFVVLMGVMVLSGEHGINSTNALFYSVMAMISGIFDVISCMLYFQHSKYKPFEHGMPTLALVAQCVFIISPIALFISASLSYSIFGDCHLDESQMAFHDDFSSAGYGGSNQNQMAPRQVPRQTGPPGNPRQAGAPVPFQGQGRRITNSP